MRSPHPRFLWVSLLMALGGLSACAGNHDALAKRVASLQTDLTLLQKHSDRLEERLEALEMRKASPAAGSGAVASDSASTSLERPRLLVVKLEPGDETQKTSNDAGSAVLRPEESAADQSPRPVIRVYGSRGDVDLGSDSAKRKR